MCDMIDICVVRVQLSCLLHLCCSAPSGTHNPVALFCCRTVAVTPHAVGQACPVSKFSE